MQINYYPQRRFHPIKIINFVGSRFVFFSFLFMASWLHSEPRLLTLTDSIQTALKKNPSLLRLLGEYRSLKADIQFNRGVYDWTVDALFQYDDADQARVVVFQPSKIKQTTYGLNVFKPFATGTSFEIDSSVIKTEDASTFNLLNSRYQTDLKFSLQQALLQDFIGQPFRVRLEADKERLRSLEFSLWRDIEVIAGDVATAYWNLWRDVQLSQVAEESEKEAKEFLDETRRLSRMGLREEDEILQAEASWMERKEETLLALVRQENAWENLKTKMGVVREKEWDFRPALDDPSWSLTQLDKDSPGEDPLAQAYEHRRDFQAASIQIDLYEKIRNSLSSNRLPQLTASGGYSLTGLDPDFSESVEQVQKSQTVGWNVGMSLRHRFGQNQDRSQIELSESLILKSKSEYERLNDLIQFEIQRALKNFRLNEKLLDLSRQVEKKRDRIQKLFRKKFRQGRTSIQDLLVVDEERRQARYKRRIAESTMALTQLSLDLATGHFLEKIGYEKMDHINRLGEIER